MIPAADLWIGLQVHPPNKKKKKVATIAYIELD